MGSSKQDAGPSLFGATPSFGAAGGIGSQLFGANSNDVSSEDEEDDETATEPPPSEPASDNDEENDGEDVDHESEPESESSSVLQAPASTPSASSAWRSAPAYSPPMYLSTTSEYLPPPPKAKAKIEVEDGLGPEKEGKSKKAGKKEDEKATKEGNEWNAAMEGYENSLEVDHVFERFAKRVGYEGEQCIRYTSSLLIDLW